MLPPTLPTILFLTLILQPTFTLNTPNLKSNSSLPYSPTSTNRFGNISFATNPTQIIGTLDLESHTNYFKNIVGLWASIFNEDQLVPDRPFLELVNCIDSRNPQYKSTIHTLAANATKSRNSSYLTALPQQDYDFLVTQPSTHSNPPITPLLLTYLLLIILKIKYIYIYIEI